MDRAAFDALRDAADRSYGYADGTVAEVLPDLSILLSRRAIILS